MVHYSVIFFLTGMKISIITASYNSAQTLRDTMESVLCQTHKDIEYIIVDGASKDTTMEIVREMEPLFEGRLRYVSEKDTGIYDAMNKGLRIATGDVIGILNSDDFFTADDVLERVAKAFEAPTIDAVYGDIHFVREEDLMKCVRYYSSRLFHPRWFRLGFTPAHPSFYCRRACYEKYGLFDLQFRISADFELMLRFIKVNGISTRYLPMDFVTMRYGGASTSGWSSHKRITKDILGALKKHGIYSNAVLVNLRFIYKFFCILYFRFINRK